MLTIFFFLQIHFCVITSGRERYNIDKFENKINLLKISNHLGIVHWRIFCQFSHLFNSKVVLFCLDQFFLCFFFFFRENGENLYFIYLFWFGKLRSKLRIFGHMITREGPHFCVVLRLLPESKDPREWSRDLKIQNKSSTVKKIKFQFSFQTRSQTENFKRILQNGDSYKLLPSYRFGVW